MKALGVSKVLPGESILWRFLKVKAVQVPDWLLEKFPEIKLIIEIRAKKGTSKNDKRSSPNFACIITRI